MIKVSKGCLSSIDQIELARLNTAWLGKKSVQGEHTRQIVSDGKIKCHLNDAGAQSFFVIFGVILFADMDQALMNPKG